MKKTFFIAFISLMSTACSNSTPKTEIDEQKHRDSMDAAQRIKDSLDVEAKMMADMAADTASATSKTEMPEGSK